VDQNGGQAGIGALSGLHQADGTEAAPTQVGGEFMKERVRVVVIAVYEGCNIALCVKHDEDPRPCPRI
jgi:hypothetical protein